MANYFDIVICAKPLPNVSKLSIKIPPFEIGNPVFTNTIEKVKIGPDFVSMSVNNQREWLGKER